MTLADLNKNEEGKVITLTGQGEIRRRLLDMGLVKDVTFKVIRYAPLGDPIEIKIKNFNLSLRAKEARQILVEKI